MASTLRCSATYQCSRPTSLREFDTDGADADLAFASPCCSKADFVGVSSLELTARFITASTSSGENATTRSVSTADSDECGLSDAPPLELERFQTASGDPFATDLDYYHSMAEFETSVSADGLGLLSRLGACSGGRGVVELHSWNIAARPEETKVVVKKLPLSFVYENVDKEREERAVHLQGRDRQMEDALAEIGIYSYFRKQQTKCPFLLQMHMVVEMQNDAWLVLQHADGGDLYDFMQGKQDGVGFGQAVRWTAQLLEAVAFLHRHRIGHRDISIENILLHGKNIQLMDFGQAVQTEDENGFPLRYFCRLGKPYFRAPERYVPCESKVRVIAPVDSLPGEVAFAHAFSSIGESMCEVLLPMDAVAGQECIAETWGYTVPPVDVFSCGVCFFMMATGMPPWEQAKPSDPHFSYIQKRGFAAVFKGYGKNTALPAADAIAMMTRANPAHRATVSECLAQAVFAKTH